MKFLFTIVCCLCAFYTGTLAQQPGYIKYHRLILSAEEAFLNGDIAESIDSYKRIFADYRPFAKDCYVAAQLCCMQKDTASALKMVAYGFERGVTIDMLGKVACVRQFLSTFPAERVKWTELFKEKHARYLAGIDWHTRAAIRAMVARDGSFKLIPHEYATRRQRDSIYTAVLDDNLKNFVSLVKAEGVPGEASTGIYSNDLEIVKGGPTDLYMTSILGVLFFHHQYAFHFLKKELMTAVVDGELQPKEYALIHDWSYGWLRATEIWSATPDSVLKFPRSTNIFHHSYKMRPYPHEKNYNMYIKPAYHSNDTAFVNKCRAEIGVASLSHDERKKKFAQANSLILFFGMFQNY